MNCANHPETPAVAYCQFCGKPMCNECVHRVGNVVTCESCLAARLGGTSATGPGQHVHAGGVPFGQTTEGVPIADDKGNRYGGGPGYRPYAGGPLPPGTVPTPAAWGTNPGVALAVGWIPGVGAVYNGQIAKALVHVAVFALLIDLTHYNGLIGLLIPIWVLYQMFDAYKTAEARRDGLPLPNPLGLNDVGRWFVAAGHRPYYGANPSASNPATGNPPPPDPMSSTPSPGVGQTPPISGFASGYVPPYTAPPIPPIPPDPYNAHNLWHSHGGGVPTGAIILIVLGVLFLLGNFGILSENWLDHGWPILLIAIGVWIVIRHNYNPPTGGVR